MLFLYIVADCRSKMWTEDVEDPHLASAVSNYIQKKNYLNPVNLSNRMGQFVTESPAQGHH
jgi:hypothetical protein